MTGQKEKSGGARPRAGRKPLPTAVKKIKGTLQKCRTNENEPQPQGRLCEPPAYMSETAQEAWRHALENAPEGLLSALDGSILERWANAAGMYRDTLQLINQKGMSAMLIKAPNGILMQSPLLTIVKEQGQIMTACAAEMGFTPSSRTRVSVQPGTATEHNPWDDIAG